MAKPTLAAIVRSALGIDRAGVRWMIPLRLAIGSGVVLAIALAVVDVSDAVPLAFGLAATGLADLRGSFRPRARGLGLSVVCMTLATGLGESVAGHPELHVAAAALIAFAAGYACIAGPRVGLAGVLALMMFAVYSGKPQTFDHGLRITLLTAIGCVIAALLVLLPILLARMGGMRSDLAVAYRELGFALKEDPHWHRRPAPVTSLDVAVARIDEVRPRGATAGWYATLTGGVERLRVALTALQPERAAAPSAALDALMRATGEFAIAAAGAIEIEVRRRHVPAAAARLGLALDAARRDLPQRLEPALAAIEAEAAAIAAALAAPYPLGRRVEVESKSLPVPFGRPIAALRVPDANRVFLRHAIRLSIAFSVATALSYALRVEHAVWLPMTVALVLKPDYASTMPRLVARVLGVLVGVVGTVVLLGVFGTGPAVLVAATILGSLLFIAYMVHGYVLAVLGVTLFIEVMDYADADAVRYTVAANIVTVAIAALLVGIVMRAWPTRTTGTIALVLAAFARALGAYATTARDPGDGDVAARRALAAARARAATVVTAARHEPGGTTVEAAAATRILADLDDAGAIAVAADVGVLAEAGAAVDAHALAALDRLAEGLDAVHDGRSPATLERWSPTTAFGGLIADAEVAFTAAAH